MVIIISVSLDVIDINILTRDVSISLFNVSLTCIQRKYNYILKHMRDQFNKFINDIIKSWIITIIQSILKLSLTKNVSFFYWNIMFHTSLLDNFATISTLFHIHRIIMFSIYILENFIKYFLKGVLGVINMISWHILLMWLSLELFGIS